MLRQEIEGKLNYLVSARPTAVNMKLAAEELLNLANSLGEDQTISVDEMKARFVTRVEAMLDKDISDNKAIGEYGARAILRSDNPVRVITHCNTGSLATAGYGTALGVIRRLQECSKLGKEFFLDSLSSTNFQNMCIVPKRGRIIREPG